MQAPNVNPKLEALKYPCYTQPLPKEKLSNDVYNGIWALYYELEGRKYYVDAMYKDNYLNKYCKLVFEERLVLLRTMLSELADYTRHIDLETIKVFSPAEIVSIYKKYLTNGYEGVRILDENGYYCFGEAQDEQFWELKPRKVEIE